MAYNIDTMITTWEFYRLQLANPLEMIRIHFAQFDPMALLIINRITNYPALQSWSFKRLNPSSSLNRFIIDFYIQ